MHAFCHLSMHTYRLAYFDPGIRKQGLWAQNTPVFIIIYIIHTVSILLNCYVMFISSESFKVPCTVFGQNIIMKLYAFIFTCTYRVVQSKNPAFTEGDYVVSNFGWRTFTISNGENLYKLDRKMYTDQKLSTALGVLGMPGYVLLV